MTVYSLRSGIHFCIANGRTAFLDVDADRYFGLPLPLEQPFASLVRDNGELRDAETELLLPLIRRDVIRPSEAPPSPLSSISIQPARRSLLHARVSAADLLSVAAATAVQMRTAYDLKHRPFREILAKVRARKALAKFREITLPEAALSAFLRTRQLVTTQNKCLRWSMAMVNFLARHRFYPDLVLGVKMGPFAAHAWVQYDDLVLNDEIDQVRQYTPILVI